MNATTIATNPLAYAARLKENARWMELDGYDRAANGRAAAYREVARRIEAEGLTVGLVDDLVTQAGADDHHEDYADYFEYNPFHAGHARGLREIVEQLHA